MKPSAEAVADLQEEVRVAAVARAEARVDRVDLRNSIAVDHLRDSNVAARPKLNHAPISAGLVPDPLRIPANANADRNDDDATANPVISMVTVEAPVAPAAGAAVAVADQVDQVDMAAESPRPPWPSRISRTSAR